jgi:two-component sensor histidine kinase
MLELVSSSRPHPPTFDAAMEANHRIANNLSVITGLVRMRTSSICKEPGMKSGDEVRRILEEISSRLDAVARLHRLLARRPQEASIDVAGYLRDIANGVVSSLSLPGQNELQFAFDSGCVVPAERALPLGLIVSELISNAVKYAHPAGVAGQITLACHRGSDGQLAIEISDDGVGLPDGVDALQHGHLVFQLVRALAGQLGATFAFHSDGLGLQFFLRLPAWSNLQGCSYADEH